MESRIYYKIFTKSYIIPIKSSKFNLPVKNCFDNFRDDNIHSHNQQ
jgi:hypothetical protein